MRESARNLRLINKTQQFETEELKAFLNKISKGINTHNILVVVKKAQRLREYSGSITHWDSGTLYRNNGHKISCKAIIKVGVYHENTYPFSFIIRNYGRNKFTAVKVNSPLNLLGLIFLHELYGAKLARNGKNHYQHQCDAWAYKKGKELGLFVEGDED